MKDGDERPEEQPGEVRPDRVAHRGRLLLACGVLSPILSGLALFGQLFAIHGAIILEMLFHDRFDRIVIPVALPVCAVSLVIAIATYIAARRDLGRMDAGEMDSSGRDALEWSQGLSVIGVILALLCFAHAIDVGPRIYSGPPIPPTY